MLSFKRFDDCTLYLQNVRDTDRETKYHGQKLAFSLVKARFDESTNVQLLRSPPGLHDSRAYVHIISRDLWDTCLNPKIFLRTHSSEIVRYCMIKNTVCAQSNYFVLALSSERINSYVLDLSNDAHVSEGFVFGDGHHDGREIFSDAITR